LDIRHEYQLAIPAHFKAKLLTLFLALTTTLTLTPKFISLASILRVISGREKRTGGDVWIPTN